MPETPAHPSEARGRSPAALAHYRLFGWSFSYFTGKVRAYLRHKAHAGALGFEEVLATPQVRREYLLPATGTETMPQLGLPDGRLIEDSSHIIDVLEGLHPAPAVIPATPRQRVACLLIELLADEWMLPYAFWERWHHSLPDAQPNHAAFNAQQWGDFLDPFSPGLVRREAGRRMFGSAMGLDDPQGASVGPFPGLRKLGVDARTLPAWAASTWGILADLEAHLDRHDYVLGGAPSLADFALFGPIHPHLYRDPATGQRVRLDYPLVAAWAERVAGGLEAGMRSVHQRVYRVHEGRLVGEPAASDGGCWLPDDRVPDTVLPLLRRFFGEMWPCLRDSARVLARYLADSGARPGTRLPTKSFGTGAAFADLQLDEGALTVSFTLGGVTGRRMVLPYHVWMLQRLQDAIDEVAPAATDRQALRAWLHEVSGGEGLDELPDCLRGCRVERHRGQVVVGAPTG